MFFSLACYGRPSKILSNYCFTPEGKFDSNCRCKNKKNCLDIIKDQKDDKLNKGLKKLVSFFSYNDFKRIDSLLNYLKITSSIKREAFKKKDIVKNYKKINNYRANFYKDQSKKIKELGKEKYIKQLATSLTGLKDPKLYEYINSFDSFDQLPTDTIKIDTTIPKDTILKNEVTKTIVKPERRIVGEKDTQVDSVVEKTFKIETFHKNKFPEVGE